MRISMKAVLWVSMLAFIFVGLMSCCQLFAQTSTSGTIQGTVTDQTNAVVPDVKVEIRNPVSGYERTVITDSAGRFSFPNVPFNPYHLTVTGKGFAVSSQDVDVRSVVPTNVNVALKISSSSETVTVEAGGADLIETDTTFHTDVDRGLFDRIPLESTSSSISSLVTLASPGIAADSSDNFRPNARQLHSAKGCGMMSWQVLSRDRQQHCRLSDQTCYPGRESRICVRGQKERLRVAAA